MVKAVSSPCRAVPSRTGPDRAGPRRVRCYTEFWQALLGSVDIVTTQKLLASM
jgi:hypothetical protein